MENSFTKQSGISFQESFQKCYNFEKKKSPEEIRKTKYAIIKETVSKINEDNMSSAVEGIWVKAVFAGLGCRPEEKSFETVPDNKKRTAADKPKVESGIKKAKNHVGNFGLYDIDEQLLEDKTSSWTAETRCVETIRGTIY